MYNIPLIKNYFKIYCRFFNIDVEIAILEGSSIETIDLFKNTLTLLLSKTTTPAMVNESLKILEASVKKLGDLHPGVRVYDDKGIVNLEIKSSFEASVPYFNHFVESFEFIEDTLGLDIKDVDVQNLLKEFNYALAHLLSSFFHEDLKMQNSNVLKSNLHLCKATLDAYKIVIQKNKEMIRTNSSEIELLNKQTYLHFYMALRTAESTTIGKKATDKNKLIINYKKFAWSLVS
jgi:hypothetical protein